MTQLTTLRLIAPEFASVDDVIVQAMLDLAPLFIESSLYPVETRDLALVYQACILLAQRAASSNGTASAGGTLVREKEGDLERQFSAGTSTNGAPAKNQYELMLAQLSMNISSGAITRMADWINV